MLLTLFFKILNLNLKVYGLISALLILFQPPPLPNNFVEYIQSLNKSFQKKIRWEMNYAEKMGIEVTFVNTRDSKQNLNTLFKLHKKRISAKGIKSSFLLKENKLFHQKLVNKYKAEVLFTEAWYQGNCIGILY